MIKFLFSVKYSPLGYKLHEKCPYLEFFWSALSRIRTRKTLNTGILNAVITFDIFSEIFLRLSRMFFESLKSFAIRTATCLYHFYYKFYFVFYSNTVSLRNLTWTVNRLAGLQKIKYKNTITNKNKLELVTLQP